MANKQSEERPSKIAFRIQNRVNRSTNLILKLGFNAVYSIPILIPSEKKT